MQNLDRLYSTNSLVVLTTQMLQINNKIKVTMVGKINKVDKMSTNKTPISSSVNNISTKIKDLKSELNKSYILFTNVRETLTNLSFTNIDAKKYSNLGELLMFDIKEIVQQGNFDKTMKMLNEEVTVNEPKSNENIPELKAFLNAINDLKEGIQKIDETNIRFLSIDAEITREIERVTKKTEDIQDELNKVDGELVREAIRIFEAEDKKREYDSN